MLEQIRSLISAKLLWFAFRAAPDSEKPIVASVIFQYAEKIADEPQLSKNPRVAAAHMQLRRTMGH